MSLLYSISSFKDSTATVEVVKLNTRFSLAFTSIGAEAGQGAGAETEAGSTPLFLRPRTGLLPFDDGVRGVVCRGEH